MKGVGAQSKERKGSNFAAQRSGAIVQKPEGPNTHDLKIWLSPSGNHEHLREGTAALMMRMVLCGEVRVRFRLAVGAAQLRGDSVDGVVLVDLRRLVSQFRAPHSII